MTTGTKTLKGKDQYDLDSQLWRWRNEHPQLTIVEVLPDEPLPLQMQSPRFGEKLLAPDRMIRHIKYKG